MSKPKASLKSSLRKSIIGTYRARGRGLNNLWLVTSTKTNQDWIIPSDRQLIHWLYFLETNQEVINFNLAPEPIVSIDDSEVRGTELDATVILKNNKEEWHEVKAGKGKTNPSNRSQFLAQSSAASENGVDYHIYDDDELKPKIKEAMRWLKPLAFANSLQEREYIHTKNLLAMNLKKNQYCYLST